MFLTEPFNVSSVPIALSNCPVPLIPDRENGRLTGWATIFRHGAIMRLHWLASWASIFLVLHSLASISADSTDVPVRSCAQDGFKPVLSSPTLETTTLDRNPVKIKIRQFGRKRQEILPETPYWLGTQSYRTFTTSSTSIEWKVER